MAAATDTVFGLMGNGNALFIRELAELGVSVVPVRHEAAAVAAADAFQRATRRLAVATTTYGPGFTNALTPLIDAALSRSPLLFIAGSTETVDHAALARACGARVETDPSEAVRVALEESVPVMLFLPWEPPQTPVSGSPEDVSSLLNGAQQLLIVAGRGAVEAHEEVIALAERWGAAVATTAPAKGFFEGASGVRDLGICGGFATPRPAPRCGKPMSSSSSVPPSTASLREAPSDLTHTSSRSTPTPPPPHASTHPCAAPSRRYCRSWSWRRVPGSAHRCARPMPRVMNSPPTGGSTRAPSSRDSMNCCRANASWSPTAATSSPGRACTSTSLPRTTWCWWAPASRPSASASGPLSASSRPPTSG